MYAVPPRETERYGLRIFPLNTKARASFDDIRTVDGTLHPSFVAANAAGVLGDDSYLLQSLQEAVQYQSAATIKSFFAWLMCFCDILQAQDLRNEFADAMSDNCVHQGIEGGMAVAFADYDVFDRMNVLGKVLAHFVTPSMRDRLSLPSTSIEYEAYEREGNLQYDTLSAVQKPAADIFLLHRTVTETSVSSSTP